MCALCMFYVDSELEGQIKQTFLFRPKPRIFLKKWLCECAFLYSFFFFFQVFAKYCVSV